MGGWRAQRVPGPGLCLVAAARQGWQGAKGLGPGGVCGEAESRGQAGVAPLRTALVTWERNVLDHVFPYSGSEALPRGT